MTEKRTLNEIMEAKGFDPAVAGILRGMAFGAGATEGMAAEVDARTTLDALMFVAALLVEPALEQDPRLKVMREQAQDLGSIFLSFLKMLRDEYERSGVHPFEVYAGALVPGAGTGH